MGNTQSIGAGDKFPAIPERKSRRYGYSINDETEKEDQAAYNGVGPVKTFSGQVSFSLQSSS